MAKLVRTYHQARMVETEVEDLLEQREKEDEKIYTEPFLNGREKGFRFYVYEKTTFKSKSIYLAENRNSDNIVAIVTSAYHYDIVPEEDWKARKFFGAREYNKAAEFVVETLLGTEEE